MNFMFRSQEKPFHEVNEGKKDICKIGYSIVKLWGVGISLFVRY